MIIPARGWHRRPDAYQEEAPQAHCSCSEEWVTKLKETGM